MGPVGGDGRDEGVKLVFFLLQLFHQALDGSLGERLALATLSVTHQAVHDAQTGVVAGGCVGDGHLDFCLWLHFLRGCMLLAQFHIIRELERR